MKIAPHPSGMLTYITQGNVLGFSRINKCRLCDTAKPGTGPSSSLLFSTHTGNNRLPSVWSGVCDVFFDLLQVTWLLLILILAKSAPNFANSLVVHEFVCVIFKTYDVLMLGNLSAVKLVAENRLAVCNL